MKRLFAALCFLLLACPTAQAAYPDCTGGTITYAGGNTVHTFNSSGVLTCTAAQTGAQYFLIGAGGGGSAGTASYFGPGAAAGQQKNGTVSLTATAYTITLGVGGIGCQTLGCTATNGTSTLFGLVVTATGGNGSDSSQSNGAANADFTGGTNPGNPESGAGAGAAANGVSVNGGNGYTWVDSVDRGGGGSGGNNGVGTGGTGGGGTFRQSGAPNTGSGAGSADSFAVANNGGSGVFIVMYTTNVLATSSGSILLLGVGP